jgi:methionine sulfoxide reductase heme-binding subunit
MKRRLQTGGLSLAVHIGALAPLLYLGWELLNDVNPIQAVTFASGKIGMILLLLSLSCTPINIITGFKGVMRLRKPLGLYAFGYALLHLLIFVVLDFGLDAAMIVREISEKWYLLVGLAAFLLLLPLAITSTRGWQRRLGKAWKQLHWLVYPTMLLVIWHYALVQKADISEPLIYAAIAILLFVIRLPPVRRSLQQRRWHARQRPALNRQ